MIGNTAGSAIARDDLTTAIESEKTYYGISRNGSDAVDLGRKYSAYIELDFNDIDGIDTRENPASTFNAGMIFLHELKHHQGLRDPSRFILARVPHSKGDTVEHMNRIRKELGLPVREQYMTKVDDRGQRFLPFAGGPVYLPVGIEQ